MLEVVLGAGVVLLYEVDCPRWLVVVLAALAATVGVAATGTLYGVLAAGLRVRETLVALAAAAGGRAGDARRDPGLGGRARRRSRRRVAVGGAARAVRGAVHGDRDAGLRPAAGGSMTTTTERDRDQLLLPVVRRSSAG